MESQVAGGLAIRGLAPLTDAGTGPDPFVAGIDELLQILVGDDFFRQIAAGARNA
jgi:hypothetical protein